jgi:hypothetical protein
MFLKVKISHIILKTQKIMSLLIKLHHLLDNETNMIFMYQINEEFMNNEIKIKKSLIFDENVKIFDDFETFHQSLYLINHSFLF